MSSPHVGAPVDLTPEFRLFTLALRRPQREEDAVALRAAIAAGPDWKCITDGARRHAVAPLLLGGLKSCLGQVPEAAMAELHRQALAGARRSLLQIAELGRLSRLFADAGIRVLILKGIVLSVQLYGNPALRSPRDIDLLVDPERFEDAASLLEKAGYRRHGPKLSPRQRAAYRRWIKDVEYIHPTTGVVAELHTRLTDDPALIPNDFAELWQNREEVALGGSVIATLPRRYLALYLCAHGAGHAWERLCWLVDLAAALPEPAATNEALRDAETAGLGDAMRHALLLAHDWLGAPVADDHLARARASRRVAWLDRILAHFYAGEAWHQTAPRGSLAALGRYSLWQRLYRLSLKSGWRYPARQGVREFISPADWNTVRLPDSLFWLYPAVRPFGWLARRWLK